MTALSQAARRIGSPDAVSWPVFWITLAAGVIGNAVTNAEAPLGVRIVALGLGQLALWLPLVLVAPVLRRHPDRPRPVLVVTAALGGLMVRALVIGTLFSVLLGDDEVRWSNRFVGALFNVGLAFVVSSYVVSAVRQRRREIAELHAVEQRLAAVVTQVSQEYAHRNEQAFAKVSSVLLAELSSLDPSDAQRSLQVLQRTATDVVRPLSHELATSRPGDPVQSPALVDVKVSWRQVLDGAARGTPFRPGATALLMGVEMVAATAAYPPGAAVFGALTLVTAGLVGVANASLRLVLPGRSRALRMAVVVASAVAVGAVMAILVHVSASASPMARGLTFGAFFFSVAFTLGVGVAASFGRDRDRIVHELEEATHALERRLVQWRQAHWFQQKSLSRALHGPIQTAVTAAALRLDSAIRSGAVDPTLVGQVRGQLLDTLGGLELPETRVGSVCDALDLIASTWEGLCVVTTSLDGGADEALRGDAALRSCVIDIVTEATSNAVRHGGATNACVDIRLLEGSTRDLRVRVASDSRRGDAPTVRGLGTRLLDECTLEWGLEDTDRGLSLVALLPAGA